MGWQVREQEPRTRSPLEGKPLRYPAQSLDEHINRVVSENWLPWVFMVFLAAYWAGWEWLRWLIPIPPQPYLATGAALFCVGAVIYKRRALKREIESLKLGRDGERAVAQYLDTLREKYFRVFHDVIGRGFNVDHVILSTHGIYTVETKTYSKPLGRKAIVRLEGQRLLVDGRSVDRDPIEQAKAQSKWLCDLLAESTGKSYRVFPIVLFPGWFVEKMNKNESREVWVLNPKNLQAFIANESVTLREDEVHLVSYHLSRYIRTTTEELL